MFICVFQWQKQLTFNDYSKCDKCSDIHKVIIVLFKQNWSNSEVVWASWLLKISSQYCSAVHTFVCSLNTVLSQIRSILSVVHSFSLTAIVHCSDIVSYHMVWCILSAKMIIENKAQSLMLIAFTAVTHSQFLSCVTNAFQLFVTLLSLWQCLWSSFKTLFH
jgi:hypothetical protein